jgi:hypothetical protein
LSKKRFGNAPLGKLPPSAKATALTRGGAGVDVA